MSHHSTNDTTTGSAEVSSAEAATQEFCAVVQGKPYSLPIDLYIPPDALEVILDAFEGPFDLLLYLIKKQNLNVLDIPVAEITEQYMRYIEVMQSIRLELAAEYLLMAGMLAEIKSRMLLPKPKSDDPEEEDPRAELVRRLQEYERFKNAAAKINEFPRVNREVFITSVDASDIPQTKPLPKIELKDLWFAFCDVLERAAMFADHHVRRESLSVRERMSQVLLQLKEDSFVDFAKLFVLTEGRLGVIVTFSAILELLRQSMIEIIQTEPYEKIHLKRR